MSHLRTFGIADPGQSLVEIALALPLLLITLLGMVDVGRAYIYTTTVTNAAREAAYYAVTTSGATTTEVQQRACNETGFTSYGAACATGITVTCSGCPTGSGTDVTVTVTYQFSLASGYLFGALLGRDSLTATGVASFRSLQ